MKNFSLDFCNNIANAVVEKFNFYGYYNGKMNLTRSRQRINIGNKITESLSHLNLPDAVVDYFNDRSNELIGDFNNRYDSYTIFKSSHFYISGLCQNVYDSLSFNYLSFLRGGTEYYCTNDKFDESKLDDKAIAKLVYKKYIQSCSGEQLAQLYQTLTNPTHPATRQLRQERGLFGGFGVFGESQGNTKTWQAVIAMIKNRTRALTGEIPADLEGISSYKTSRLSALTK